MFVCLFFPPLLSVVRVESRWPAGSWCRTRSSRSRARRRRCCRRCCTCDQKEFFLKPKGCCTPPNYTSPCLSLALPRSMERVVHGQTQAQQVAQAGGVVEAPGALAEHAEAAAGAARACRQDGSCWSGTSRSHTLPFQVRGLPPRPDIQATFRLQTHPTSLGRKAENKSPAFSSSSCGGKGKKKKHFM